MDSLASVPTTLGWKIFCKITASQIHTKYGVRQSVTVTDEHCLSYIVTRIHHNARRPSLSEQRQDRLATYMACTLKISQRICVMRSQEAMGFGRALVSTTGWSSVAAPSSMQRCGTPDFLHVFREKPLVRSTSSVPYRRPRIRSQIHCVLHDPRQRSVPSPTTAFRRSTVRLHHGRLRQRRLHHWRLQQWSLHQPLGEHREVVQHYPNIITNGRRGACFMFLHLLNNRRKFLNDHLFLRSRTFNCMLRNLPCNDLFLMDWAEHKFSKLFNERK